MKAYIYKKQLVKTGKYYIGKHNGKNKYYKGSGTLWREDYKKYVINKDTDVITEILEYIDELSQLNERERYWLEFYNAADDPMFYNKTNKNYGATEYTQETKDKIGKANQKPKPKGFLDNMKIPVIQYSLNGDFIQEWDSITDASKNLNLHNVGAVCRGEYKTCGGYIFRFKHDPLPTDYAIPIHRNKNKNRMGWVCEKLKGPRPTKYKPIIQYDLNENFIKEWDSLKDASVSLNINTGGISQCCMGYINSAGGYKFKYK